MALLCPAMFPTPRTSGPVFLQAFCLIPHCLSPIFSLQTQRDGLIFIYDMTNSTYANFDYELCVKILNLLKVSGPVSSVPIDGVSRPVQETKLCGIGLGSALTSVMSV